MDKDKLKLIVRNLELLVDSLKAEVYSDVAAYQKYTEPEVRNRPMLDYDEVFDDDDDVTSNINISYKLTNDDDGDGL